LSHAPELTDGNKSRELFSRLTHSNVAFGTLAVDGFFLLSGFLIARSWDHDPELLNFLKKRVLRIVPGYLVAVILSTIAVGILAPGVPHFFSHFSLRFPYSVVLLGSPDTPPVLPGAHYNLSNGALWTINYEFRCYLLVGAAGILGLFRRPAIWLSLTLILLAGMSFPAMTDQIPWSVHLTPALGNPTQNFRMIATFCVGACFYLFQKQIAFRPQYAVFAGLLFLMVDLFATRFLETVLVLAGAYLMFYLGQSATGKRLHIRRLPDISYGIYVYGWPVEALWIWFHHGSPWVTFIVALAITIPLGWLSWHFVERPMLSFKKRSTAALPAA
jgi:peptidoglycan/LPS O-acetylase OafA/YrhL